MRRLRAAIGCDIRLQFRNGFYYVVAVVLAGWVVLLSRLPSVDWGRFLPPLLLGNLTMATFYFIGGLVLLEKGEGTLEAQVVTPLTIGEYLASKVITLVALSLVESMIIVCIARRGIDFSVLPLVAGIVSASVIYILFGFMAVARYDAINEFLFPSVLYTLALALPLIPYFGLWESGLFYLHPLQAPLLLMKAAFQPVQGWQMVYGFTYSAVWIIPVFLWSKRSFHSFVVIKAGVR